MSTTSKECGFPGCKQPAKDKAVLKECGGCRKIKYCRRECQRAHWKEHKKICKKKKTSKNAKAKAQKKQIKQSDEKKVLWVDQQRINKFGRLNNRLEELKVLIKAKTSETENLKEAVEDIDNLLDDDACKIKIGDVYVEVSNEEAEEYTKECEVQVSKELDVLKTEVAKIGAEMAELKKHLYAKFGTAINLETTRANDPKRHLQKKS